MHHEVLQVVFNRGYSIAIFAFWLAAMAWLVKEKLLPPLLVGDPPSYRTILAAAQTDQPVAWEILLNGRSVGGAITTTERLADGINQLALSRHPAAVAPFGTDARLADRLR